MLESIKKKLSSAIKEGIQITGNLSTQLTGATSSAFDLASESDVGVPSEINVAAGSELLQKYGDAWRSTYDANKANVDVAKDITDSIDRIRLRMKMRQVNMTDLVTCLSGLPTIEANLKECLDEFNRIEELARDAEEKLNELSNVCHMLDVQEELIEQDLQEKRREMEELRIEQKRQANEKRKRIREEEERLKRLQRERQAAFEEAFISDMHEYKTNGFLTKIDIRSARLLTLDEVDLNIESDNELEDFLND